MNEGIKGMDRIGMAGAATFNGFAWVFSMADSERVGTFLSTPTGWVQLAQITSLFAGSTWFVFQAWRGIVHLKKEQKVAAWVKHVTRNCEKAASGDCPLKAELEKLEKD